MMNINIADIAGAGQKETCGEDAHCSRCCGRTGRPSGRGAEILAGTGNPADRISDGYAGCFLFEGGGYRYFCHGGQLLPSVPSDPLALPNPVNLLPTAFSNPFVSIGKSPSLSPNELIGALLNIPDVSVEKTEITDDGDVIVTVGSTAEGTCCHKCGREISKSHGIGREIFLRHLSLFGRKTYICISPPRYQCPHCENTPTTTQKAVWYEQGSPYTKAYEDHVLLQSVNSTVSDVSIKDDIGYDAVTGIIDRRIAVRPDWKEIRRIDVLGMDEISLRKGHRDFVTIVTAIIGGKTVILAVLRDRKKETVKKFLKTIPKRLRKTVGSVCSDMYEGFINAAKEVFGKKTRIITDRFHVARLYRDDLDELRKKELMRLKKELPKKEYGKLKGAMWALRKKEEKLTDEEKQVLECLFGHSPELKKAYDFCRELTDIFEDDISKSEAARKIRIWKIRVRTSGLKCFDGFLKTLEKWSDEITNYFINRQTSGFVEGLNNKIKVIKRRCYGITNTDSLFRRIFLDIRGYSLFA
ncbi:MAG: ISL3 family transposase [Desulfobacteraceae bacterium]|nr:ISL3 family transposase [Desulfobacteraceae bacterium]